MYIVNWISVQEYYFKSRIIIYNYNEATKMKDLRIMCLN